MPRHAHWHWQLRLLPVAVAVAVLLGGSCQLRLALGAVTEDKLDSTFLTPSDFDSFHLSTWSVDFGRVADEPLMYPAYEWDEEIGGKGTILVDPIDRLYKAWYILCPLAWYISHLASTTRATTRARARRA